MPLSVSSTYPGTWHVQYSSRNLWNGKRNANADFTSSNSLSYSYQEYGTQEVKSRDEKVLGVVATGKDGKLESWMTEVDGGIVDTAGEIRADWRSHWIAVVFLPSPGSLGGVDIICNRQKRISDETVKDISTIFQSKSDEFGELNEMVLLAIPDDGARNAEMKRLEEQKRMEWERRTGKDEGISEDLVYDDVEQKKASGCGIQ